MREIQTGKLTFADRVRGWFDADYAARASVSRYIEAAPRWMIRNYMSATERRTDTGGWASQPWAPDGARTLTPHKRRSMVRRAREIDENNMLGSSLLDRAVDNIIGHGMTLQSRSASKRWRKNVEAAWRDQQDQLDVRGMMMSGELQRTWYRSRLRDGDVGMLLLRTGAVQTIESDYIQSPGGAGDMFRRSGPEIIDGVEINGIGRPIGYHVATVQQTLERDSKRVAAKDMIWYPRVERNNKHAVRGIPLLAQIGPWLDQIDGTVEAVVMAHRMAALFGLIHKRVNPAAAFGALPNTTTNADGNDQKSLTLEPAMVDYIGSDEDVLQIKPEHPTTSFGDFMKFLIRLAGLKLGLPLELALLDFSDTNYSSARASMEQAYRHFRIEQNIFTQRVMTRLYRWRVSKLIKDGELANAPSDALEHKWYAPEWPYLDPQKEAEGALVAVDAGFSTLTRELGKRGLEFSDWLDERVAEVQAISEAGLPLTRSNKTRDTGSAGDTTSTQEDDEPNEDEGNADENED